MVSKTELLEYLNIFGVNLRRHRNSLKLSYDGVAQRTGVSKSILSRIENGQTAPSFETFLRLYQSLGVTTDFFKSQSSPVAAGNIIDEEALKGGFKFKRMNFMGRAAVSAEVEEIKPGISIKLQSRRSCEENILVVSGECRVAYTNIIPLVYSSGELFTIPQNKQIYEIYSEAGATIIRIAVPVSRDQASTNRYLTVLGGTSRGIGGKGVESS